MWVSAGIQPWIITAQKAWSGIEGWNGTNGINFVKLICSKVAITNIL